MSQVATKIKTITMNIDSVYDAAKNGNLELLKTLFDKEHNMDGK
jgi:hypothetical protein